MTPFLPFTDKQTPPSERQNMSENDLPNQDFEDHLHSGNFENK